MFNLRKRAAKKTGLPPGTPVYVGERKDEKVKISVLDYDQEHFDEKELEQVEIRLAVNPSALTGYLDVNGVLNSLPIGSTLDQDTGRFFWSPGPGFVGPYTLLFIIEGPDGQTSRKTVKILIQPKY